MYPTTDLYIIAAGKGSRMASNVPKALVPIVDEPCLTTTLKQIGGKFHNVFIVTNNLIQDRWTEYFLDLKKNYPELADNVRNIPIASGLGDGHAVMQAIEGTNDRRFFANDDIVIAWGDVFFPHAEIIDELVTKFREGNGFIPAVRENNPYVSLLVDDQMRCTSADFSKYGENHPTGFHDQSVFRFDRRELADALSKLHNAFWKGGRYITPGGELSLLYTFHLMYNSNKHSAARVYETDYPTLSFNTPEEVAAIQHEINIKWQTKFRNQNS